MTGRGTAALPEGGRIDFEFLRAARRRRLFSAMADHDLDVLVLGRPSDITFASGVRALWTAGSRPFSPSCVVVAGGERIHLLSTWDEGVPAEIPREHLFGLSWNPAIAARHVATVPGVAGARRIGTAGTSAGVRKLLAGTAPDAEIVDARAAMADARATKSPWERAAIETACAIAEAALEAMQAAVAPGVTTRQLLGVHAARVAALGAPVVPDESVAQRTGDGYRTVVDDRPLEEGDVVALCPSASYAGYEGTVARTTVVGGSRTDAHADLAGRCRAARDAVVSACRPGATGGALLDAWHDAGGGPLPAPLVHGVGLGTEPPVVGFGAGSGAELRPGMVLAVQAWRHEPATGGWLERDVVSVTDDGPQLLTR